MEFGFVSFNQDALNKANKVMKLLQGQGAIDEMGLGRIRDAFSNMMFPGLSTLQTRAKYFLIMPALYSFLERTKIENAQDARTKIRENEISLTKRLIAGTEKNNAWGIIGADTIQNNGSYVKYDPAYIYQAGMETYGLVKSGGNIYRMLSERSYFYHSLPNKLRNSEELNGDAEELKGVKPIFLTSGENYYFHSTQPLSINLTPKEAKFLRGQIISNVPDSLLAYILDSNLYTTLYPYDFETLEFALKNNIPVELFEIYILARRYSRFTWLLRLRYAMLYDIGVGSQQAYEEEKRFFDFLETYPDEFTVHAIDEILSFVQGRVTEESCKKFCRNAAKMLEQRNWEGLDELIVKREEEVKTLKRSKLRNIKDFEPGKSFETPKPMSFRWNTTVKNIMNEIKVGLENE